MRKHKVFGLLVILLALCFVFAGCDSSSSSDPAPGPGDTNTRPQPGDPIGGPPPGGVPARPEEVLNWPLVRGLAEKPGNWLDFRYPITNPETKRIVPGTSYSFTNLELNNWFTEADGGFYSNQALDASYLAPVANTINSHATLWRFVEVPTKYYAGLAEDDRNGDGDFDAVSVSFESGNPFWILHPDTTVLPTTGHWGYRAAQVSSIPGGTGIAHQMDFAIRAAQTNAQWRIVYPFTQGGNVTYTFYNKGVEVGEAVVKMPMITITDINASVLLNESAASSVGRIIPLFSFDWPNEIDLSETDGIRAIIANGNLPLDGTTLKWQNFASLSDAAYFTTTSDAVHRLTLSGFSSGVTNPASLSDLKVDIAYENPRNSLFPEGRAGTPYRTGSVSRDGTLFILHDTRGSSEFQLTNEIRRLTNGQTIGPIQASKWDGEKFLIFASAPGIYTVTFTVTENQAQQISGIQNVLGKAELVFDVQQNFLGRPLEFTLERHPFVVPASASVASPSNLAATPSDNLVLANLGTPSGLIANLSGQLNGVSGIKNTNTNEAFFGVSIGGVTWRTTNNGYFSTPLTFNSPTTATGGNVTIATGTAAGSSGTLTSVPLASISDLTARVQLDMATGNRFNHLEFNPGTTYYSGQGRFTLGGTGIEGWGATSASDIPITVISSTPNRLLLDIRFINRNNGTNSYIPPPNG